MTITFALVTLFFVCSSRAGTRWAYFPIINSNGALKDAFTSFASVVSRASTVYHSNKVGRFTTYSANCTRRMFYHRHYFSPAALKYDLM
jgi:hypothetical protein